MDKDDDTRRLLIREALAAAARNERADPAAGWLGVWARLATHLNPLIGEAGYCALYGRALRLVGNHYPGLASKLPSQPIDTLFSTLKENLSAIGPASAGEANFALLDTFTGLLSGLIGEALTTRLLNTAWADEPEGKKNE